MPDVEIPLLMFRSEESQYQKLQWSCGSRAQYAPIAALMSKVMRGTPYGEASNPQTPLQYLYQGCYDLNRAFERQDILPGKHLNYLISAIKSINIKQTVWIPHQFETIFSMVLSDYRAHLEKYGNPYGFSVAISKYKENSAYWARSLGSDYDDSTTADDRYNYHDIIAVKLKVVDFLSGVGSLTAVQAEYVCAMFNSTNFCFWATPSYDKNNSRLAICIPVSGKIFELPDSFYRHRPHRLVKKDVKQLNEHYRFLSVEDSEAYYAKAISNDLRKVGETTW